jgi:hypothetical protein
MHNAMGKGSATGVAQLDGQLGHSWSNSMATPVHRVAPTSWPSPSSKMYQLDGRAEM